MQRVARAAALALALMTAAPAAAEEEIAAPTAPVASAPSQEQPQRGVSLLDNHPGRGLWAHDNLRYGQRWWLPVGLVLRTLMDLVAIPSGVVAWDARDWATAATTVAATLALSLPFQPSLDVRLQRNLQHTLGGADHPRIWTPYGDMLIWATLYASLASTFLYGLLRDQPEYVEAPVLAIEAFAVMQVFHWGIKALAGRDGPDRNVPPGELTSDGYYHGPAGFKAPYGSGTPSGHVGSMYAMFTVLMYYFDTPALWVGLNVLAGLFCVTIVADNYHYLSEVLVGAVMGFATGRWVVEHRSSRYRNDPGDGLPRRIWRAVDEHVTLVPTVMPGGGVGGAAVVRF